jgi:CheY-like chemotaxis protein
VEEGRFFIPERRAQQRAGDFAITTGTGRRTVRNRTEDFIRHIHSSSRNRAGTKCHRRRLRNATLMTFRIETMSGIVIYEEDDLMCALLQEWLRTAGYRVRAGAQRGDTADLVIASVYMPKQAGAQRVREIQTAHPGTPLIAISGQFRSGLSAVGSTAQTLGVRQVIAKPLTRCDLLEAVRAVIGAPAGHAARC